MKQLLSRRPSPSMVVALTALVVAASGTAIAATKLVNGDKLIAKNSLSGNRLKNHTITGTQVNLKRLGKVPSAQNADNARLATLATNAQTAFAATNATNALNAQNAINANTVGGQAPAAFEPAANNFRTGIVKENVGDTKTLMTFGPFTVKFTCTDSGGNITPELDGSSSEANSEINTHPLAAAGSSATVLITTSVGPAPQVGDNDVAEFLAPSGKAYEGEFVVAANIVGFGATCIATGLVTTT